MKKLVTIVLAVAVMGLGTHAFAGMGRGGWHHGSGMGMGQGMGNRCPAMQNLSAEDMEKVNAERTAFWNALEPIRTQIREKHFALRTEMSKTPADSEKISALEKEITELRSQMDEKRVQFQANLKKISPELADCPMGGAGFMKGRGWRHGQNPNTPSGTGVSS